MKAPRRPSPELLFQALLSLSTEAECAAFLEDLLTPKEFEDLVHRLDVASLLWQEKTYEDIQELTGASSTTIARVRRCLERGPGGYTAVLRKITKT